MVIRMVDGIQLKMQSGHEGKAEYTADPKTNSVMLALTPTPLGPSTFPGKALQMTLAP